MAKLFSVSDEFRLLCFLCTKVGITAHRLMLPPSMRCDVLCIRTLRWFVYCDCMMYNSNWHPISYRSLLFKFWTLCVFESQFVHLGLIGKCVVDFLLVLIELFARCYCWVATSEKRSKIGNFAPMRSVSSKISGRRGVPHHYCTDS